MRWGFDKGKGEVLALKIWVVVYIYSQSEICVRLSFIYPSSCLFVCIYEVTPQFSFDFSLPTEIQLYSALLSWHLFSPNHLFSFEQYFPTPLHYSVPSISPTNLRLFQSLLSSTLRYCPHHYSTLLSSSLLYATVIITTLRYCPHHYSTLLSSSLFYAAVLITTLRYCPHHYSTLLSSSLLYATVLITTLRYCHHHYSTLLSSSLLYAIVLITTPRYCPHHYSTLLSSSLLYAIVISTIILLPAAQLSFVQLSSLPFLGSTIISLTWAKNSCD